MTDELQARADEINAAQQVEGRVIEAARNMSAALHDCQGRATTRCPLPINVVAAWQLLDEALRAADGPVVRDPESWQAVADAGRRAK